MKNYNNKSWYSVILAILMVWFMLVLTSWVFWLILLENKDTKAMEYYLKSFAWAEGSLELAMLKAKKYNYSYSEVLKKWDPSSKILFRWWDELYNFNKDVFISYDLNSTSSEIVEKTLSSWDFDIVPLFYYDKNWSYKKVKNITISWLNTDVVWNIVWSESWISWVWNFSSSTLWNLKTISSWNVSFEKTEIWDFLNFSEKNYLIIHNVSSSEIKYTLKSLNSWEYLTKESTFIVWTWEVWWYKQNLRISIDNSKYLNLLKYSIFSWN